MDILDFSGAVNNDRNCFLKTLQKRPYFHFHLTTKPMRNLHLANRGTLNPLNLIVLAILLSSCSTSFLVSNLNTTSNPYLPQPMKQKDEPNKSETYVGVHFSSGINMEYWGDYFATANIRLAQGHALGQFRIAYGGNLSLGGFYAGLGEYAGGDMQPYRDEHGGKLFMGAVGANAKISYAVPIHRNRVEWRFGLEGAAHKEFGDYLYFRKQVPGDIDIGVETRPVTYTAGFFSEWVMQTKKAQFGFKVGGSLSFCQAFKNLGNEDYGYDVDYQYEDEIPNFPFYYTAAFLQRFKMFCVFEQINFGTASFALQYGVLYIFGKNHLNRN